MKNITPIPHSERPRVADVVTRHMRLARLAVNRVSAGFPWADRDDLFGEACLSLTLTAHLYRYRPDAGGLSEASYYFRCVRNHLWIVLKQRLRRGHDHVCLSQVGDAEDRPPERSCPWADHVAEADRGDWLDRAEGKLPESYRRVFRLHFRDGLTQAETGRATGFGEDYVHILVRKICGLLRDYCEAS